MKAYVLNDGDLSVGIDGECVEIDMPDWLVDNGDELDEEQREGTRHILQEAFAKLFDTGQTYVIFEGEKGRMNQLNFTRGIAKALDMTFHKKDVTFVTIP